MAFDRITIKYDGKYYEFDISDMDMPPHGVTDQHILNATRRKLEELGFTVAHLDGYIIDPPEGLRLSGKYDDKGVLNVRQKKDVDEKPEWRYEPLPFSSQ